MKLAAVQVFVSDLDKAEKWYSKVLGMKLVKKNKDLGYLVMRLGKSFFYIETRMRKWGQGWDKVKVGGRTNIIFEVEDIEKEINKLKKKGVVFVEKISKRVWGEYKAVFKDPFGNEFNLVGK